MRIVGANDLDVVFAGEQQQLLVHILLADAQPVDIVQAPVALQFDVKILAQQVQPPAELLFGFLQLAIQDSLRYFRPDAAAGGDQPLVVLFDQFLVDTGKFAVQAFDKAQGA